MKIVYLGLAATVVMVTGTAAQAQMTAARLDALAAELTRDFGDFGMAVAVIEDGRVATERHYGLADRATRRRVDARTLFNVASVSKAVSAWGIMRLVEQGRVAIDDPVFDRIRTWQLPASEFPAREVTPARLLSHTGGISRHTTGTWTVGQNLPTLQAALSGDNGGYGDTRLIYRPGTRWSYSGGGYSLLQLMTEEITGLAFTAYMNRDILPRLGFADSRYGWGAGVVEAMATPYDEFGRPLDDYRSVETAAGGLNATVRDLARFAIAFADRPGRGGGLLRPETVARIATPMPNADAQQAGQFGLGVMIRTLPDGRTMISHDGGNPGWGAIFMIDPASGDGIAVAVNRSWGGQVFLPVVCAWQNATTRGAQQPCGRDWTGVIVHLLSTRGIADARARYDALLTEQPARFAEGQMLRMARQLLYAERPADAATVLRWHLGRDATSAAVHDRLGDALRAGGDEAGARAAWTEALRIDPARAETRRKLEGGPAV